jgi:hypothetical protein
MFGSTNFISHGCTWCNGSWSFKSDAKRVVPVNATVQDEHRLLGQFIIMLFVQVAIDCLSNAVYPSYLIYRLVYSVLQTAEIAAISSFLINISFTLPYINYIAGFY